MKKLVIAAGAIISLAACKKEDSQPKASTTNVVYQVSTSDTTIKISYSQGYSRNGASGNESLSDWSISKPGFYMRKAEVKKGYGIELTAFSYISQDFGLAIKDEAGNVLAQSDSAIFYEGKHQYVKTVRITL